MRKPETSEEAQELLKLFKTTTNAALAKELDKDIRTIGRWRQKANEILMLSDQPEGLSIKGTSTLYDSEGNKKIQWVKTDKKKEDLENSIRAMLEAAQEDILKAPPTKPVKDFHKDIACVIPIGDAHIGMFAWEKESGDDWDLDLAEKYMCGSFDYLVRKAEPSNRAIIINVGDYFHYSKMTPTTDGHGHVLSASGRPQNMFATGLRIMRYGIAQNLKKHNKVEVINASGNHDGLLAFALSTALANIYENEPRVIIHDQPTMRHYTRFGKCLFGVVHGHQTKDANLPIVMATEMPKDWGETLFRYWFRGHHHHEKSEEFQGCYVEQIRTLAASDDFSSGGAYLSGRDMTQIYFHRDLGKQGHDACGIDLLKRMIG